MDNAALGVFEDVLLHDAAIGAIDVNENRHLVLRRVRHDADHGFRIQLRQRLDALGGAEGFGDVVLGLQVNHFALHDVAAVGADVEDFRPLRELVQPGNGRFFCIAHHARVENRFRQFHVGRGGVHEGNRGGEQAEQGAHRGQVIQGNIKCVSYRQQRRVS